MPKLVPPTETPWGKWEKAGEIIPGVWHVTIDGKKFYWVSAVKVGHMPTVLCAGIDGEPSGVETDETGAWFDGPNRVVVAFAVGKDAPAFLPHDRKKCIARLTLSHPNTAKALGL